MFVHTACFTAGILHCLFSVPLQTVALLNSMCPKESTLSMGSPPSYYSTSQKPTELWNKQVSMQGLSPHPRSRVPRRLHSNESNLALHETFLLPNENPVLSPFLMMSSFPLQAKDRITDLSLTCSDCVVGHEKGCFSPSDPKDWARKEFHLFLPELKSLPHAQQFIFSSPMQS